MYSISTAVNYVTVPSHISTNVDFSVFSKVVYIQSRWIQITWPATVVNLFRTVDSVYMYSRYQVTG